MVHVWNELGTMGMSKVSTGIRIIVKPLVLMYVKDDYIADNGSILYRFFKSWSVHVGVQSFLCCVHCDLHLFYKKITLCTTMLPCFDYRNICWDVSENPIHNPRVRWDMGLHGYVFNDGFLGPHATTSLMAQSQTVNFFRLCLRGKLDLP